MAEWLRQYFLGIYAVGIVVVLLRLPSGARAEAGERRPEGARRYLPVILLPASFLLPPLAVLLHAGELRAGWAPVRLTGLLLGLYAAAVLPWSALTLGRLLVPRAVVSPDHVLLTRGPFRWMCHPTYSGNLALWLGTALGTLNVCLLALWPVYLAGLSMEARVEEELLESRFGDAYRTYARRTWRFVPRPGGHAT